jgi:uncharacterized protein (DUF2147 family)
MKQKTVRYFMLFCLLMPVGRLCAMEPVEGYWKSVDDESKKVTAFWRLEIKDGRLYGYIVNYPDRKESDRCNKCVEETQDFHNMPILGTPWLLLSENDDGTWENGYIIDSGQGKKYKAKVWFEEGKLKMRGYIGFFYRTQSWLPARQGDAVSGNF